MEKLNKIIFLGIIAQQIFTNKEYRRLVSKAIKGYNGNIPKYDENKLYDILSKNDKLKPYLDNYYTVQEFIANNEFDKAKEYIENITKE